MRRQTWLRLEWHGEESLLLLFTPSDAKKDKCGVCNGDGSECKTVEGLFDERALSTGACHYPSHPHINVFPLLKVITTSSHCQLGPLPFWWKSCGQPAMFLVGIAFPLMCAHCLAIKNGTGHFLLNGNYQIQVLDKNIMAGGTAFRYEKGEGGTE